MVEANAVADVGHELDLVLARAEHLVEAEIRLPHADLPAVAEIADAGLR